MAKHFQHWYSWLLTTLLSALGFTSCGEQPDEYGTPVEYGVPHASFTVKGTVTTTDGQPIQGIKVSAVQSYGEWTDTIMSTKTDANGNYELEKLIAYDYSPNLMAEDVDGADNGGHFETKVQKFKDLPSKQTEKGDGWYEGHSEVTGDIKMNRKP